MNDNRPASGCLLPLIGTAVALAVFVAIFGMSLGAGYAKGGGGPPRIASDDVSATASGGSSVAIVHGDNNRVNQSSSYTAAPMPTPTPQQQRDYHPAEMAVMLAIGCLFPLGMIGFILAAIFTKSETVY